MFINWDRVRSRIASLLVVGMVATMVVAVPVSAADAPVADYTAVFDACAGSPSAGFTDVPSNSDASDDIDCIAYYGITKGTSATTYSPSNPVIREHMALFLIRLARVVGIEVPPAGQTMFDDVDGLSATSQEAISQLSQLGITEGTSSNAFSPADAVRRAHMALFIQRLMKLMTPISDGDVDTSYGYLPSDVVDNEKDIVVDGDIASPTILAPFTDLNSISKYQHDAVTQLYELGVAQGISETAYIPDAFMTRASMALFMAAVLDHSNARPAGLSIQAMPDSGWGVVSSTVVISVRDDTFLPVEDQPVDMFSSAAEDDNFGLLKNGMCDFDTAGLIDGDCEWDDNDSITDENGNIFLEENVDEGDTKMFYAWIGEDSGDEFDSDTADYVTVTVESAGDATELKIESSISEKATGNKVDLRTENQVTFTAQLISADGENAARSGVTIQIGLARDGYSNTNEDTLTTDKNGRAIFAVFGPDNKKGSDQSRTDTVSFTAELSTGERIGDTVEQAVMWVEETQMVSKSTLTVADYVTPDSKDKATVKGTVQLYDQYGNARRSYRLQMASVTIGTGDDSQSDRSVTSKGVATWSRKMDVEAGTPVPVSYQVVVHSRDKNGALLDDQGETITDSDGDTVTDPESTSDEVVMYDSSETETESDVSMNVQVVTDASSRDTGVETVVALYADSNLFLVDGDEQTEGDSDDADTIYRYDTDDVFVGVNGGTVSLEEFEVLLGANFENITTEAVVDVVLYSDEDQSIFTVDTKADGS